MIENQTLPLDVSLSPPILLWLITDQYVMGKLVRVENGSHFLTRIRELVIVEGNNPEGKRVVGLKAQPYGTPFFALGDEDTLEFGRELVRHRKTELLSQLVEEYEKSVSPIALVAPGTNIRSLLNPKR